MMVCNWYAITGFNSTILLKMITARDITIKWTNWSIKKTYFLRGLIFPNLKSDSLNLNPINDEMDQGYNQ